ncbi:MAG: TonB-dependent receptor [Acidobacteria bacterium]|nr:TonB-dependent receptor [Acidobacteriota bacterium]
MSITRSVACVLTLFALAVPAVVRAQTTGSISGVVFDQGGQLVDGASIRLTGTPLPGERVATSDANGSYRFPLLLPGAYTLEVTKAGGGDAKRAVTVSVDMDTQVDIVLGLNLDETIEVSAAAPVVDLKSTEVNFNYGEQLIKELPLQRTYAGLIQLVPGVADNNPPIQGMVAGGGSRQDNTFMLDGVNITNPGFGYLSTEVNEFDIAEFNVKRGAITAEFGRSSGFVANAVTRSGTNQFKGGVRFEAIPAAWNAKNKATNIRNTTDRWIPSYAIGGPILRDRLFFYTSGMLLRSDTSGRVNNLGPVPDSETTTKEFFGKVTYAPAASQFINAGYRVRPSTSAYAGVGVNDSPEVATDSEGTNRVATANWNMFFGQRNYVEAKYLRLDEEGEAVARTDLGYRPTFDLNNLRRMGYWVDPTTGFRYGGAALLLNRQNYARNEFRVNSGTVFNIGKSSHDLRAGFMYEDTLEDLTRIANGWGTITLVESGTRWQGQYYPTQNPQLSKSRTYSFFVQDNIQIGSRLVLNAGVLVNKDEFAQQIGDARNTFLTFDYGDQVQPRLGVNYQLRKGAGDKVYANYGRYYGSDQKSSARAHAPLRLVQNTPFFNATTGALISDTTSANTTNRVIRPGLQPTYTDEWLVGYATPLGGNWGLDAFYMDRTAKDFIEDQPSVLPASTFVVDNLANARRDYKAFTLEINRRMADRWSTTISYAWSQLKGNFDLDYAAGAVFNTSSILQDGPGVFVEDDYRYGPLGEDRPHVLKVFGTYMVTDALSLGGYLRVQSGTPYERRVQDWYGGYRLLIEPLGTSRNDTWTNADFLVAYNFRMGGRVTTRLEARVLNLFDTQTALSRDNRAFLDPRTRVLNGTQVPGDPASYTRALVINTNQPNSRFGTPTSYAPPRRLLLTARIDF